MGRKKAHLGKQVGTQGAVTTETGADGGSGGGRTIGGGGGGGGASGSIGRG